MKKPAFDGLAFAEKLYGSAGHTERKVSKPTQKTNKTPARPSQTPGVQYPLTKDQEELLGKAWTHFCDLKDRGLV